MVGGPLAIIEDDDIERAADHIRPTLALYIGGMGARGVNFHHEVFVRMGYEAEARKIQDLYLAGDKKSAIAAVPTKLVEDVALIGPWAKIAEEIQRWKQTVLTTFSVHGDPRRPAQDRGPDPLLPDSAAPDSSIRQGEITCYRVH